MKPILKYPDLLLKQPTVPVGEINQEIRDLVEEMIAVMRAERGIGLAAPQIGSPARIFVVEAKVACMSAPAVFINPTLLLLSEEKETAVEGCLSCPGMQVKVERSSSISIDATDLDGNKFFVDAEGLYARVIQHEYDHLQGRLIADLEWGRAR